MNLWLCFHVKVRALPSMLVHTVVTLRYNSLVLTHS